MSRDNMARSSASERVARFTNGANDPALVAACRERGVFFTVCPTTTTHTTTFRDLSSPDHAIRRMLNSRLNVVINTDDPALFRTDLATEYVLAARRLGCTPRQLGDIALNGLHASWLDDATKRSWIAEWGAEIDGLLATV